MGFGTSKKSMNITERFLLNNHPSFVWCRNFWGAEMSLANLRSFVTKDIREAPVFYTQVRGESRVTSFFSLDHVVQSPSTSQGADVGWIETLSFWLNLPSIETELFLLVGCLVGWNPHLHGQTWQVKKTLEKEDKPLPENASVPEESVKIGHAGCLSDRFLFGGFGNWANHQPNILVDTH